MRQRQTYQQVPQDAARVEAAGVGEADFLLGHGIGCGGRIVLGGLVRDSKLWEDAMAVECLTANASVNAVFALFFFELLHYR